MKTNKNSVRRNLIISATALMLSIAMLIGTTFAWFTDSVTSGRNHIQAGNLDVELTYKNKDTEDFSEVTTKTQLFDDSALWEPGHVEYVVLNVHNAGTLALKYNLNVTVDKETEGTSVETNAPFKLSSFLKYAAVAGDISDQGRADMVKAATAANPVALSGGYAVKNKSLLADSKDDTVTLVVWMPEETGNAANYTGNEIPTIELGLTLVATQYTEESDSFDNTYDKDAKYPAVGSTTAKVDENGKVAEAVYLETTEKIEGTTDPIAKATVPANARTTAASGDDTVPLVLRVEEAPNANITGVDTTTNKLRTLEVTMDGLSADNQELITVGLYMGRELENFKLYHNGTAMTGKETEDEVTADQDYYYNKDSGYVIFKTKTFFPFSAVYKKDVWTNHAAESLTIDDTSKTITVGSAEELALFAKNFKDEKNYSGYTLQLTNDIDLGEYIWEPIKANGKFQASTIDGGNHTIRNMVVRGMANTSGYGCGFIGDINGSITIRDISFDNADVFFRRDVPKQYYGNVGSIVLGYTYGTTLFENVSVTNSEIWGYGKIGVMLGMGADPGVKVTFKGCTSKDNTIHATYNVGGLAGNIQRGDGKDNASVENCKVENIVFDSDPNESYIKLNNASATFSSNDKADGTALPPKSVSGTYWVYGGYYWGGYADYYVSYGDGSYDAPVDGYEINGLANGEYCVNK